MRCLADNTPGLLLHEPHHRVRCGVVEIIQLTLSNGHVHRQEFHWRVWPVKLSSTSLELSCKKSVRSGYVIALGFIKYRGVCLLARFPIQYLRMLTEVVLGCLKNLRGGLGTTCMGQ